MPQRKLQLFLPRISAFICLICPCESDKGQPPMGLGNITKLSLLAHHAQRYLKLFDRSSKLVQFTMRCSEMEMQPHRFQSLIRRHRLRSLRIGVEKILLGLKKLPQGKVAMTT